MKKNISINISGIIFHIEEDGFDTLKKYLDSINRYFSTFEDSSEILADIESRIAEIFLSKLNEEKQVITAEDVNSLIATMGSVNDFKAVEEGEPEKTSEEKNATGGEETFDQKTYTPPKALYRDQKRKILGGVCAGLGNYFNFDPLWFRLLFAGLIFAGGFIVPVYIIMWIIVPGSYTLDEPVGKKMFRDPDTKIIGGVSGGVAGYFGIDLVLVRVLFILLVFAGFLGFFIYIILWISLPEAHTITEKMQMQGEPVTLSNIESSIKKNFNIREGEAENTLTKILLFPFRLLGMLFTALGNVIEPLGAVIRVIVGILIILVGVSLIFGIVVTAGVLFGLFAGGAFAAPWFSDFHDMDLPIEVFTRAFPGWIAIAAVVAALIPAIFLMLLGASAIARKLVFRAAAGWTLFAIFIVSVAMLAVGIPRIIYAFHDEGAYTVENTYSVTGGMAVLQLNESFSDFHGTQLTLRGHDGPGFRLVQSFESHGSSRANAIKNAKMVEYNVTLTDSVFTFDENIRFKEDAIFRGQHLDMILYVPYDFPFRLKSGMQRLISRYDITDGNTWRITRDGLQCLDCDDREVQNISNLRDFDEVEITGKFDVRIIQGHEYSVDLNGPEEARKRYTIRRTGETLQIAFHGDNDNNDYKDWDVRHLSLKEVYIVITMPYLERLKAMGAGTINFDDFSGEDLDLDVRGPVEVRADVNVQNLTVRLAGSSVADLSGHAENMNARLEFASRLKAYDLEAGDAFVEASTASNAKVHVTGTLEMEEGLASDIDVRGEPRIVRHD